MCATCMSNHYVAAGECIPCHDETASIRIATFIAVVLVLTLVLFSCRRRLGRLRRKYGFMWRNILRIFTINLAYSQINCSLPTVITLPLPKLYLEFLERFNWVNIDIISLLSLRCIQAKPIDDFQLRVVLAAAVPVFIVGLALLLFLCQRQMLMRLGRKHEQVLSSTATASTAARLADRKIRVRAIEYLYRAGDVDESGAMDEHEFKHVLHLLHHTRHHHKRLRLHDVRVLMKELGGVERESRQEQAERAERAERKLRDKKGKHTRGNGGKKKNYGDTNKQKKHRLSIFSGTNYKNEAEKSVLLSHTALLESAVDGTMEKIFGYWWVARAEIDRAWRNVVSVVLILLFLLHAPLSQRFIYYFACHAVPGEGEGDTQHYLRSDYAVECGTGKHQEFAPFVYFVMATFTFLLPLTVLSKLFHHRRHLYSPAIRQRFGFLYSSFNRGAEFWELHEVFRKLILTGLLIFVQEASYRAVAAIIVCIISVASLNYLKPHQNWIVFLVAQCSFFLSAFKYLALFLLSHSEGDDGEGSSESVVAAGCGGTITNNGTNNSSAAGNSSSSSSSNSSSSGGSGSGGGSREPEQSLTLGSLLVFLDLVFLIGSTLSCVAMVWLLRNDVRGMQGAEASKTSRKRMLHGALLELLRGKKSSSRLNLVVARKAIADQNARKAEDEFEEAHLTHVARLTKKQSVSKQRLEERLRKRKLNGLTMRATSKFETLERRSKIAVANRHKSEAQTQAKVTNSAPPTSAGAKTGNVSPPTSTGAKTGNVSPPTSASAKETHGAPAPAAGAKAKHARQRGKSCSEPRSRWWPRRPCDSDQYLRGRGRVGRTP